jgi:hypothetical protein
MPPVAAFSGRSCGYFSVAHVMILLNSRNHSAELATAAQHSQSLRLSNRYPAHRARALYPRAPREPSALAPMIPRARPPPIPKLSLTRTTQWTNPAVLAPANDNSSSDEVRATGRE